MAQYDEQGNLIEGGEDQYDPSQFDPSMMFDPSMFADPSTADPSMDPSAMYDSSQFDPSAMFDPSQFGGGPDLSGMDPGSQDLEQVMLGMSPWGEQQPDLTMQPDMASAGGYDTGNMPHTMATGETGDTTEPTATDPTAPAAPTPTTPATGASPLSDSDKAAAAAAAAAKGEVGKETAHPTDQQILQYLQSLGPLTPQTLNQANSVLNAAGIKQEKDSAGNPRGRLYMPDGRTVDLGQFGGSVQWQDRGAGWGQGDAGGASGSKGMAPFTIPQLNFGNYGYVDDAIKSLIGQMSGPVTAQDPQIAAATNAFRAQSDTGVRQARRALAERDAAAGLNSGGAGSGHFESGIQSQIESGAKDVANYQDKLIMSEMQSRRQTLVQALQLAQGSQRIALQQQISMLDEQMRAYQMNLQNQQFYDQLGVGIGNSQNSLNMQYLQSLLG